MQRPINPTCPDCGEKLREGFLIEVNQSAIQPTQWASGVPEKSIWTGTKMKGREKWQTAAWRCPACGLVKLYAREQVK